MRVPAVPRGLGRGICTVERDGVRKRHVACAERVISAQRAEGILDRVATLHADERPDSLPLECIAYVPRRESELKPLRMHRDESPRNVYLLELNSRKARVLHFTRHIHRPELRTHHSFPEPPQIRVPAC